jgi:Phage tail tube protein FII
MSRIDEAVINFAIYEDGVEYLGMADVTLPELTNLTQEIKGAGIGGNIETVIVGHLAAMSMTLNFRTVTEAAIRLAEPRIHKIDLRSAQQSQNTRTSALEINDMKYIVHLRPKKFTPGKLGPASPADASGEFAVSYYSLWKNGQKRIEVDPINFIYYMNDKDYLKDVRRALGK